jgi:hypothetical protein
VLALRRGGRLASHRLLFAINSRVLAGFLSKNFTSENACGRNYLIPMVGMEFALCQLGACHKKTK